MRTYPVDSEQIGVEDGHPILDNAYTADDLGDVYKTFVTNGVFTNDPNALKVVGSSSDMTVSVYSGKCFIEGRVGNEPLGKDLTVSAAHSTFDRIDTVVARWDGNRDVQSIDLFIVEGAPQSTPQRPTLTRNDTVYEIGLADVLVTAGSTTIDNIRITDTRLDPNRCGSVSLIQPLDTTSFMEQMDGIISDVEQAYDDAISGTLAGNLQNQITENKNSIDEIEENGWVTTDRLSDGAVTANKIQNNSITGSKLVNKTIGATQLADAVNDTLFTRSTVAGTDSNWIVKKYNDGWCEALYSAHMTGMSLNTPASGSSAKSITIPSGIFKSTPSYGLITATTGRNDAFAYGAIGATLYIQTATKVSFVCNASANLGDVWFTILLVGKWK